MSQPRKIPRVLSERERRRLLKAAPHRQSTWIRNELMVRVMLNCGLRAAELLNLKVGDFNRRSGALHVLGKRKKERICYLNEADHQDLLAFAKGKRRDSYLFSTRKGGRILDRYLRRMVAEMAAKAKLGKRVHPHLCRHTFATDLYNMTEKDIKLVQRALGHASMATTAIYTYVSDEEVKKAMRSLRGKKAA